MNQFIKKNKRNEEKTKQKMDSIKMITRLIINSLIEIK